MLTCFLVAGFMWVGDAADAPGLKGKVADADGKPRIKGTVKRPNGEPAADAEAQVVGDYGGRKPAKADSLGRFELPVANFNRDPSRVLCLLVRDPARNLAVAQDLEEETESVDLVLAPGMTVVGRAECDGKPVTNGTAALVFWTGRSGIHLQGMAVTNQPGRFEITALPPGRRYGLYVSAPGYGQKYVNLGETDEQNLRVEVGPVELKLANLKLAGVVMNVDEKPMSGISVYLNGDGQPSGNATTDQQGRFKFESVCEGRVNLSANGEGVYASTSAEGGETNVVLRLGQRNTDENGPMQRKLHGVVKDPDGKPVAGAQVAVFPSPNWVRTGSDGRYTVNWTTQPWQMSYGGDPCLVVRTAGLELAGSETISEEVTNLDVQLKPAWRVTGKVLGAEDQAIAKAEIGIWLLARRTMDSYDPQPIRTDAEGNYEIRGLPPGPKYTIYASAKDHGRSQIELDPDPYTNHIELPPFHLRVTDQVIAGQVVDEKEKPLSGVQIHLSGNDQPSTSTNTDAKGRFFFRVCEGSVQLFASAQERYGNLTVGSGETNISFVLSGSSNYERPAVSRASLVGKPLPDLNTVGLSTGDAPKGKAIVLCLLDAEQRPSRRAARLLSEQCGALAGKGIAVLAVQALPASNDTLKTWQDSSPVAFKLGRVVETTGSSRWATQVNTLPWLILCDKTGKVVAEGFPMEELEERLAKLGE